MNDRESPLPLATAYESLVARLDPAGRLERVVPLGGGISAETSALEWRGADGALQTVVVRRIGSRGEASDDLAAGEQYTLLCALDAAGVPVPEPLFAGAAGQPFAEPFVVLRHIPGKPELAPRDPTAFARTLAWCLADIHQRARRALERCEFLPRAIDFFGARLARPPFASAASYPQRAIRETLARTWPLPQRNPDGLLHGDFWAGNLIWQDGALRGVIDWADALIGDPLVDVAIARLDLTWMLDSDTARIFTDAYLAATGYDASQLPYWDLFATLRPGANLAGWASVWPALGRSDLTEHTMSEARDAFATRALERLA